MKLIFLVSLIFTLSVKANIEEDVNFGINLFENGQYEAALEILEPLAKNDSGLANYYIGLMYDPEFNKQPYHYSLKNRVPITLPNNKSPDTVKHYKRAAELGVPYAYFRLMKYYESVFHIKMNRKFAKVNERRSRRTLEPLAAEGDWRALYMLALSQKSRSKTKFMAKTVLPALEKQAQQGDRMAQFYLAKSLYLDLCELTTCGDISKAFAWFYLSGAQGSYHAKHHLKRLMLQMNENELEQGKKLASEYLQKYIKNKHQAQK